MTVLLIAGARPNFMKIAPLYRACPAEITCKIVHTGQHYDANMSQVFFDEHLSEKDAPYEEEYEEDFEDTEW